MDKVSSTVFIGDGGTVENYYSYQLDAVWLSTYLQSCNSYKLAVYWVVFAVRVIRDTWASVCPNVTMRAYITTDKHKKYAHSCTSIQREIQNDDADLVHHRSLLIDIAKV